VRIELILKTIFEFIEFQRQAFPRLYFLSDESVIELISENKSGISKLDKFLQLMFFGIHNITINEDTNQITGFKSFDDLQYNF